MPTLATLVHCSVHEVHNLISPFLDMRQLSPFLHHHGCLPSIHLIKKTTSHLLKSVSDVPFVSYILKFSLDPDPRFQGLNYLSYSFNRMLKISRRLSLKKTDPVSGQYRLHTTAKKTVSYLKILQPGQVNFGRKKLCSLIQAQSINYQMRCLIS